MPEKSRRRKGERDISKSTSCKPSQNIFAHFKLQRFSLIIITIKIVNTAARPLARQAELYCHASRVTFPMVLLRMKSHTHGG